MTGSCLVANWRNLPPESRSRLGIVTAARIGNAVSRNRTRRLLRETFRLHQHELNAPVDLVIVASLSGKPAISKQLEKMGLSAGEHYVHFLDPVRVGSTMFQLSLSA